MPGTENSMQKCILFSVCKSFDLIKKTNDMDWLKNNLMKPAGILSKRHNICEFLYLVVLFSITELSKRFVPVFSA